jgi:exosortase
MGAALLAWRDVPVKLSGNVILLPGRKLFLTEACSGLRSLAALVSLGVLVGGLWLRTPAARLIILALTIPVAIVVNAIRVFLTGFLVYFVDPKLGEGFLHLTEGWFLFVAAFAILGSVAWAASRAEDYFAGVEADA